MPDEKVQYSDADKAIFERVRRARLRSPGVVPKSLYDAAVDALAGRAITPKKMQLMYDAARALGAEVPATPATDSPLGKVGGGGGDEP